LPLTADAPDVSVAERLAEPPYVLLPAATLSDVVGRVDTVRQRSNICAAPPDVLGMIDAV
jgi:hypothetical protein